MIVHHHNKVPLIPSTECLVCVSEESLVEMDFLGFVFCVKPKTLMNQVKSPESYLVHVNVAKFVDSKSWTKRRKFHETNQTLI